jgi:phage terminase Nu1 subunit (DNA packaging protein)
MVDTPAPTAESGTIAPDVAARLLMVTPDEFTRLAKAGWFAAVSKGRYRIVDVVQGHIRFLQKQNLRTGKTVAEAAAAIDMGVRRFFELLEDNVIVRKARDAGYDLDEVILDYIRHLRKVASGRGADNELDLAGERAKLAREQTEGISLKNAIARGEYVLMGEVIRQVEGSFVVVRQRMLSIPGKMSDSLRNQDDRELINTALLEEITEALNELSEPSRIAERAGGNAGGDVGGSAGARDTPAAAAAET